MGGAPPGTIDPATGMPSGDVPVPGEPLYPGAMPEAMSCNGSCIRNG